MHCAHHDVRRSDRSRGLRSAALFNGSQGSDEDFAQIRLQRDDFHGEWNYRIYP